MDNFIAEIKNNIKKEPKSSDCPNKLREILKHIVNTPEPKIQILNNGEGDGDVKFSVSRKYLGISYDTLLKYRAEIFSDYVANFLGELLVRDNIEEFAKILTGMLGDKYSVVNEYEHRKFGMEILRDEFIFIFHISLLQSILTEDFKRQIKRKFK